MSEWFIRIRKLTQSKVSMRSNRQSSGKHGEWCATAGVCVCVGRVCVQSVWAWLRVRARECVCVVQLS